VAGAAFGAASSGPRVPDGPDGRGRRGGGSGGDSGGDSAHRGGSNAVGQVDADVGALPDQPVGGPINTGTGIHPGTGLPVQQVNCVHCTTAGLSAAPLTSSDVAALSGIAEGPVLHVPSLLESAGLIVPGEAPAVAGVTRSAAINFMRGF